MMRTHRVDAVAIVREIRDGRGNFEPIVRYEKIRRFIAVPLETGMARRRSSPRDR